MTTQPPFEKVEVVESSERSEEVIETTDRNDVFGSLG